MLHVQAGGAAARPFETHHHALDMPLTLRIALELHLKRLRRRRDRAGVRDRPRVPQRGPLHAPQPRVHDARGVRGVRRLHRHDDDHRGARRRVRSRRDRRHRRRGRRGTGRPRAAVASAHDDRPHRGARGRAGAPGDADRRPRGRVRPCRACRARPGWGPGKLVLELYEKTVEPNLVGPIFVLDYPREVSPLARTHRDDPDARRAVRGRGARAGSWPTRSASSTTRSTSASASRPRPELAAAGDEEAHGVDEDYVRALEYGLPPCGGLGIGVDRLVMLVAGVPLDPRGHPVPPPASRGRRRRRVTCRRRTWPPCVCWSPGWAATWARGSPSSSRPATTSRRSPGSTSCRRGGG